MNENNVAGDHSSTPERPLPAAGSVRAWLMASRPPTLLAAVAPVLVGTACAFAAGPVRWWPILGALMGAIWIQIGTNFANDVFDFEKGADTAERLGPTRAVQAGLLSPAQMRRGMVVAFGLALLCGVYLTWAVGWPIAVIGVASILSGIAYTGGPWPLGYNGLGDVFVMLFFGFVAVVGTAWVGLGAVPPIAWWAAVPPGALATNILAVNNLRDRHTDRRAGKGTLVARFGRSAGVGEFLLLLAVAYAVPVLLWLLEGGLHTTLLPLVTLPRALFLARQVMTLEGPELNRTLVGAAQLLMLHSILFAAGIAHGLATGG